MDLVKFSDTGGVVDYTEEPIATLAPEPSMDDIVKSMRSHLFGNSGSTASATNKFVYACSRGNGGGVGHASSPSGLTLGDVDARSNSRFNRHSLDSPHNGTRNEAKCMFTSNCRYKMRSCQTPARHGKKTHEISHHLNNGSADEQSGEDSMLEDDNVENYEMLSHVEHPRLMTPFYRELRKRYPQAFCRRSSRVKSERDMVNDDMSDTSTAGWRHRQGMKKSNGILKNHPSMLSLCSEVEADVSKEDIDYPDHGVINSGNIVNGNGVSRSDSTLSLRERRLKNKESMRSLLAERPSRLCKKSSVTEMNGRVGAPNERLHKVANGAVADTPMVTMVTDSPHTYTNHDTCNGYDALPAMHYRSSTKGATVSQNVRSTPQVNGRTSPTKEKHCQQTGQLTPNKDSDGDSGITNGSRRDLGENITADTNIHQTSPTRPNTGYCFEMPVPVPCATRRHVVRRTSSTASGPLKADHNIHAAKTSSSKKHSVPVKDDIDRGARPKVKPPAEGRPSSADSRPLGVRFEDEVPDVCPLSHKQRSLSQPLLDSSDSPCLERRKDVLQRFRSDDQLSRPEATLPQPGAMSDMVAALEDTHLESSMQILRASPVVVMPTNSRRQHRKSLLASLRTRTHLSPDSQISSPSFSPYCVSPSPGVSTDAPRFNNLMVDGDRHKKKRLPWRRNCDRFMPTNNVELMETKFHRGLVSPPNGWCANRSAGSGSEGYDSTPGSENAYESIDSIASKTTVVAAICTDGQQKVKNADECNNLATGSDANSHTYAQVNRGRAARKPPSPLSSPSVSTIADDEIESIPTPPLPQRLYERELSSSRSSLADGIKMSAKRTFHRLRKAVSLDRLDRRDDHQSDRQSSPLSRKKKSPSLLSLRGKLGFGGKKDKEHNKETRSLTDSHKNRSLADSHKNQSGSLSSLARPESPSHFQPIGKLVSLNADGSQLIELTRPLNAPYGFYIARGNAKYNHAIFVSRMSDSLPSHCLRGLLSIGDEIREINGCPVTKLRLDVVYEMMSNTDSLLLKTLPFMART